MSFHAALPPWLLKAVEQAGDATVILKPGDRPFVIRSRSPYHLGTQPLTNMGIEGIAQQILTEAGQQALNSGESVEETITDVRTPVNVSAVRLDHDIVIKLRCVPKVDEIAQAIEEETRIIRLRTAVPAAAPAPPPVPAPAAAPEPELEIEIPPDDGEPAAAESPAGAQTPERPAHAVEEVEAYYTTAEVDTMIASLTSVMRAARPEAKLHDDPVPAITPRIETFERPQTPAAHVETSERAQVDTFERPPTPAPTSEPSERPGVETLDRPDAAFPPASLPLAAPAAASAPPQPVAPQRSALVSPKHSPGNTPPSEPAAQPARRASPFARPTGLFGSSAKANERDASTVRAEEESARREQEADDCRAEEEAARREKEEAARRERDTAERGKREEAERREREEAERREREEAERREQEEAAQYAREDAARQEREDLMRREQEEDAARRALEEAALRAQGEAGNARPLLENAHVFAAHARVCREPLAAAPLSNDSNDYVAPTIIQRPKSKATVIDRARRRAIDVAAAGIGDWITEAMDRGATVLYLRSGKAPSARVDGKIETLATEPVPLSMFERAGAMMTSAQDGWRDAGEWAWTREMPGAGTVQCHAFSDGQGGGFIVQLPVAVGGLDQQVPRHIRAACETGEGLVIISAPFEEDMTMMVSAAVAWNSQRRAGFVVAFGSANGLQNIAGDAFVSERTIPSTHHEMAASLQNALRERPDVIVIAANDTLPAPEAIVAAAVGRLVIVGVVARTAPKALEVLLKDMGPDRRALAAAFRGACSWRGFRRPGSQRVVIADSLVASDRVTAMIETGDITALHTAQFNRENGMRALDPALAAAVTRRKITFREAAACAVDRKALIGLVRRQARDARAAERQEEISSQRAPVTR